MSYGENKYKNDDSQGTIHAEDCAVRNLQTLPKRRKLEPVSILVIRTSKCGEFGNSKPCSHCILTLNSKLPEKGYKLDKVYYTDASGKIQQTKFRALFDDKDKHVSIYYANRGTTCWNKK